MPELNEVLCLFFIFIVILIRTMPCDVILLHLIFSWVFQNICSPVTCMLIFVSLFCCFSFFLHVMSSLIILHKFGGKNCPHFIYELSFYHAFIKNYIFLHMLFELSKLHFLMPACILLKFCRCCV